MSEVFTKSMARNIYYGGSVFFILLFLALTFDTSREVPKLKFLSKKVEPFL